jgi:spore coat polysaccharide biosynthesis protein SpsF
MPTVAIIQARMGSSRLPGKVLKDLGGRAMLSHVVERARKAKTINNVVVATTLDPSDDAIEQFCTAMNYPFYRGSLQDVLDRFYQAAKIYSADPVVRLTADCPLLDPDVLDKTVNAFFETGADFAANRLPPPFTRTYPIGLDTEVCSFAALERAWHEAQLPYEREHVLPYLYDQPGRFKVVKIDHAVDYGHLRWTVDTPEDLDVVRRVFDALGQDNFGWLDVLDLYRKQPDLFEANAQVQHKTFMDVDHRLGGK